MTSEDDVKHRRDRTAALLIAVLPLALTACSGQENVEGPTVEVTPGPMTTPDLPEVESPEPEAT